MRKNGHAPDNRDFQELTAAAAEVALTREDGALQDQVASMCNITSLRCVDLHGMSVSEARAAVLCVVALLQRAYRRHGSVRHGVAIITGRGEHSEEQGQALLRPAVIRLLEEELSGESVVLDAAYSIPGDPAPGKARRWLKLRPSSAAQADAPPQPTTGKPGGAWPSIFYFRRSQDGSAPQQPKQAGAEAAPVADEDFTIGSRLAA